MCCGLLKFVQELLRRCTQYVVNFVDLIEFVVSWEERKQGQDLEENAADSPDVHFVAIVAICHEAFRCSIPTSRYIFCQRWFTIKASTATKVCQLDGVP